MADWCGIGAEVLGYGARGNGFITTAIQKRSPILGERFLRF
jgi:hypothetical protein